MFTIHINFQYCVLCLFVALMFPHADSKPNVAFDVIPKEVGDPCLVKSGVYGSCQAVSACPRLEEEITRLGLEEADVANCGYTIKEEIICCPKNASNISNKTFNTGRPLIEPNQPNYGMRVGMKAEQACRRFSASDESDTVPLVIGGDAVKPGQYPHMVAIGYKIIGKEDQAYLFECGGSLIDKRFVLTAAHCVVGRTILPRIVRLGIADMQDPTQLKDSIDIPIKLVHVHPHFTGSPLTPHNDIALIELERDIGNFPHIYPACLHTEMVDPPVGTELNVTGWGVFNASGINSSKLLQARVQIYPLHKCQEFYDNYSRPLRIENTQLCTFDDACLGDSGGPLNLFVSAKYRRMRIVGVVSVGIGCAQEPPSVYTRVAAYMDFIESIVWP